MRSGAKGKGRGLARSSWKPRPGVQTALRAWDPRLTRALPGGAALGPGSLSAPAPASSRGGARRPRAKRRKI